MVLQNATEARLNLRPVPLRDAKRPRPELRELAERLERSRAERQRGAPRPR